MVGLDCCAINECHSEKANERKCLKKRHEALCIEAFELRNMANLRISCIFFEITLRQPTNPKWKWCKKFTKDSFNLNSSLQSNAPKFGSLLNLGFFFFVIGQVFSECFFHSCTSENSYSATERKDP